MSYFSGNDLNDSAELRHRSLQCTGLINITSKSSVCTQCDKLKLSSKRYLDRQIESTSVNKRNDYMSREELLVKLNDEKRKRINAERREKYIRQKLQLEMVDLDEEDHSDISKIFTTIDKDNISSDIRLFWEEQAKSLNVKGPTGHRWHPKVIRVCLSIFNKSPEAYKQLKASGMLALPSGRLLQLYKNSVTQNHGFNPEVLDWMQLEADKLKLNDFGKSGGIIFDEMSIQEDIQMKRENGKMKLVGMVSLGEEYDARQSLSRSGAVEDKINLATHVLQFVFLGHTGFRFPFAHWPTTEVDAVTLREKFYSAIRWLLPAQFRVHYCCCDGGEANRQFVKSHFPDGSCEEKGFQTINPYTREPLFFIMDPYHNIKKIRNNIHKSGDNGTRLLQIGKNIIEWNQFKNAYENDQTLKIHRRLTEEHFQLGYASKMRNHLAMDVLNKNMLFLIQAYLGYLKRLGQPVDQFAALCTLLTHTSKLVDVFEGYMPIQSPNDDRFDHIKAFLDWLNEWENDARKSSQTKALQNKRMFSSKLRFDLASVIMGFEGLCKYVINKHPGCGIVPARTNSNIVENVFCQQRMYNGHDDNPNYLQYCSTMNSVLIGQTTTTKRSNTGGAGRVCILQTKQACPNPIISEQISSTFHI